MRGAGGGLPENHGRVERRYTSLEREIVWGLRLFSLMDDGGGKGIRFVRLGLPRRRPEMSLISKPCMPFASGRGALWLLGKDGGGECFAHAQRHLSTVPGSTRALQIQVYSQCAQVIRVLA